MEEKERNKSSMKKKKNIRHQVIAGTVERWGMSIEAGGGVNLIV